jgi:hypothetical protein
MKMLVEGVSYGIKWKKFRKGYSIFIPCLNGANARLELLGTTKRLKIKVLTKVVIENGIRGLRIWKM